MLVPPHMRRNPLHRIPSPPATLARATAPSLIWQQRNLSPDRPVRPFWLQPSSLYRPAVRAGAFFTCRSIQSTISASVCNTDSRAA